MPEIVQPDPTQPGFTGDAAEGLCHRTGPHRTSVWVREHRADLTGANLTRAILTYAKLQRANLTGVIGADFRDAKNVPAKYLKD